ncbi:hypothetical protein LC040_06775 [Bacillus tianshenii]|nr:hypothetical protein LC040_06775 [Bacillus tianshenii]
MLKLYVKATEKLQNFKDDETGAQAVEWVALAGVVIAVMAGVSAAVEGNSEIGNAVTSTLSKIVKGLSGN